MHRTWGGDRLQAGLAGGLAEAGVRDLIAFLTSAS